MRHNPSLLTTKPVIYLLVNMNALSSSSQIFNLLIHSTTPYSHSLLTTKPLIYLVNMSSSDFIRKKNKWLPKIHAWVQVGVSPRCLLCVLRRRAPFHVPARLQRGAVQGSQSRGDPCPPHNLHTLHTQTLTETSKINAANYGRLPAANTQPRMHTKHNHRSTAAAR